MTRYSAIQRVVVGEKIAFCPARDSCFRLIFSPAAGSHSTRSTYDPHSTFWLKAVSFNFRNMLQDGFMESESRAPAGGLLLCSQFWHGKTRKMGSISTQVLISASLSLRQNEKIFLNTCSSGTPGENRDSNNSNKKKKKN